MSLIESTKSGINVKLWRSVAIVSGIFAFLICFLVIANYIQINRLDPVNTEAVNLLVQRLSENPNDEALRNEIRALDLLVRKAYFTNQWQVRTGGYILLISLTVMLISIQLIRSAQPINPEVAKSGSENDQFLKKISRKWISIGGGAIVVIALVLVFLTHDKLEHTFKEAAIAASTETTEEVSDVSNRKVSSAAAVKDELPEQEAATEQTPVEEKEEPKKEATTVITEKAEETVVSNAKADLPDFVLEARKISRPLEEQIVWVLPIKKIFLPNGMELQTRTLPGK